MREALPNNVYDLAGKRIFVAGHRGMVGAALMRRLAGEGGELLAVRREQLDLRRQADTERWFAEQRPDVVFLAAAKVGGILANSDHPAAFLYDNLMIAANVMEAARQSGTERLIFLGSSCIYPKHAPQPIPEEALLSGSLESTNEAYAVAKIAGIKLAEAYRHEHGLRFISAQPTNLYGPGDNFDLAASHVIPALMRKAYEAKESGAASMEVWGSGTPFREFLHVDDLADALVFLASTYDGAEIVNVGTGDELSIADLAHLVCEVVGYKGELRFDASKPDGTPRKRVSVERLTALGWHPRIPLRKGLEDVYAWFRRNYGSERRQPAVSRVEVPA